MSPQSVSTVREIYSRRLPASDSLLPDPGEAARIYRAGDFLYRMGDPLNEVFLIRSGSVKVHRFSESGEQQIVGFYLSGDIVGFEALATGVSGAEAVVLDTSSVSRIDLESIYNDTSRFTSQDLTRLLSASLNRENDLAMMLTQRTADRRIAWFLTEYSSRLRAFGLSPREFSLPMTRTDIAVYLGLALETVCRELAALEESGLIRKDRRRIYLLDIDALRYLGKGQNPAAVSGLAH